MVVSVSRPNPKETAAGILDALRPFAPGPGQVLELRALNITRDRGRPYSVSGYYDDLDALARDAARLDGGAAGIYVTMNPAPADLLARSANRFKPAQAGSSTQDQDITRRDWLLVDLDPERASGISSTAEEHAAALNRAEEVSDRLQASGWPPPVIADSGNGAHVLFRLDLPNDDAARILTERVLRVLALLFSDEAVRVDTTVGNASRIRRLYGTLACKGDSTSDRPHRRSRILELPEVLDPVPLELLEALADRLPDLPARTASSSGEAIQLGPWLQKYGILLSGPVRVPDRHGESAEKFVIRCPNGHEDGSWALQFRSGAVAAGCHHATCSGFSWRDLRDHHEPREAWPGGNGKVTPIPGTGRGAPTSSAAVAVTSDEEEDLEEEAAPSGRQRPTLDPVALYGLAGEFVRLVEPETEADPAALLFSFLLAAGHCFGRSPYFLHERNVHRSNLFCLLVGDTASGRKGTSWGWVQDLFWLAAQDLPETCRVRIRSGLSSGEGVLECMRPPTPPEVPAGKEPPPVPLYDPRVFVLEGEFAGILKNFERKGNTLSSILRSAWDGIPIGTMTRNPIVVEEHHLTLLAHVTPTELAILLPQVETANGFLNRFLVVFTERSKSLPEGGSLPQEAMLPLAARLRDAILIARNVERVERDEGARRVWRAVYEDLACGHPGPMGAATSRALAQVSRLALIYALLDGRAVIQAPHLLAAVAAWKYCFDSAGMVFGDSTGSRTADKILQALRREPEGLTRTRILREVLQGNCPREKLAAALFLLKKYRLAEARRIPPAPGARKASELWRAS